ncbi:unnamed protein product [Euphydryas editha]|uniref:Uncharacterized protein n=1 Tax=Euphydryas editha TaxID=104508 RepID=A0AAU9UV87_EUPED|nr:unnamed protein product [Euphydryas editha]
MKTEDQILAQLRATQNIPTPPTAPFLNDTTSTANSSTTISTSSDAFSTVCATPDLEKLQKLMQSESIMTPAPAPETKVENEEVETPAETPAKPEPTPEPTVKTPLAQTKQATEKTKQAKTETEKPAKVKEPTKSKKKAKEDKKEDNEAKNKEEETKSEKASVESSPTKNKKEDKQSKKELEKEKKEWIKEGFTIVKGPEKASKQESKKKVEENKAVEEAEKKKKEEEKQQAEEERKRKLVEATNKQKEQQQRQILESLSKKAPWSATQAATTNKDGLTLAEIQRLEREKKLEQIKEQQHMMQLIAQQQAAALAREQVINDNQNLPWSKKKTNNGSGQSLAEIQAETRRQSAQAAAAAAAAAQVALEEQVTQQPQTNHAPWGNSHNGGGFWDTQPNTSKTEKPQESTGKPEKKKKVVVTPKKETSPVAEFEAWCGSVLTSWSSKIDVPTFVGFLKDIESPYEVKDYVKCYLGESKDANDFARHFLERRSKLLRVGMVTPSDDLCSPAMAVNPRASLSDYQEVKGKGKKSKKNKMLKVDARILGFSVTAAEDRINVGDIDTV